MVMTHKGGCLCGKIRFEALGEPISVSHCHCVFCRRQTGAAFATFVSFRGPDSFAWTGGKPATYRSSPTVRRRFCRHCGTPLTFEAEGRPGEVDVAISAFDHPDGFPPQYHGFVGQKIAWLPIGDGLPQYAGSGDEPVPQGGSGPAPV